MLITSAAGVVLGVNGQAIRNCVPAGRRTGYRLGRRMMVPTEISAAQVEQVHRSHDLEEIAEAEAARLVAEGRAR